MRSRLTLLIWVAWLCVAGWIALFRTEIATDLTFFLPRNPQLLDAILVQQMRTGPASRLLLIALEGGDEITRAEASRQLTRRLRAEPDFETVLDGPDQHWLSDLEGRLFEYRYALNPALTSGIFTAPALRSALMQRLQELATPAAVLISQWLPHDPTGAWQQVLRAWQTEAQLPQRQGVWVSHDGQRALLLARTRASGFQIDQQAHAQDTVQTAFNALPMARSLKLILGGPGVLSVEADRRITHDAAWLSIINTLLVAGLIYLVYRSLRILALGLIPLFTGLLTGVAVTSLVYGGLHGITLGFGATLLGVAADYPNHFFTHLAPGDTPHRAMRRIWPTLRLGVWTNVAGFASMLCSGFTGLMQLALFAGAGLLAAGYATRWVLPCLSGTAARLPTWISRGSRFRPPRRVWLRILPWTMTLALLASVLWASSPLWNDEITALNPVPNARQVLDARLQEDFLAPDLRKLIIATAAEAETALQQSEQVAARLDELQSRGVLTGYDAPSRYLPSQSLQRTRLAHLPPPDRLNAALQTAAKGLPFQHSLFDAFLADALRARTQTPLTRAGLEGTPLADRVDSLLLRIDDRWVALLPLTGIHDEPALEAALAPLSATGVQYVDLQQATTRIMRDYRQEAVRWLTGSLVLIGIMLAVGLKSCLEALRVLVPVLLAGLCTALLMALWFGGLNLYHLVSLLLVIGLSLDQALFFNHDAADDEERRRTWLSLLICSSSAVLAFGTLALSEINILRSIGTTVAVGAVLAIGFASLLAQRPRHPG